MTQIRLRPAQATAKSPGHGSRATRSLLTAEIDAVPVSSNHNQEPLTRKAVGQSIDQKLNWGIPGQYIGHGDTGGCHQRTRAKPRSVLIRTLRSQLHSETRRKFHARQKFSWKTAQSRLQSCRSSVQKAMLQLNQGILRIQPDGNGPPTRTSLNPTLALKDA